MTNREIEEWRGWLFTVTPFESRDRVNELCDLAIAGNKYQPLRAAVEELLEVAFFDDDMIGDETQAVLTVIGRLLHGQDMEGETDEPS